MATVYLAEDLRHARKVAIKVLKPELAESVGADRFLQEIRTTANLRHPHIVPLYDSGQAAGFLFYVMPYVEGESLEQRLERERQLSVDETLKIAGQVADALGYAHERDLLHRDIKPGNIMLERGHAVVTDFGVARAVSAAGGERLTSTGLAVGTPAYMSPEQATGDDRLDARSDLYSLACVTYEMLAGQPPFTGATASVVMARHSLDPVPPLATVRPGLPAHVGRVVERALAKIPADRFASTAEWSAVLAAAGPSAPVEQPPRQPAARPEPGSSPGPSEMAIAVLPIRASSDDPDLLTLAEELTEDITAGLTRFTYLDVVGGGDRAADDSDPRLAARDLGARYVLSGRLRQAGKTVRVAVKLIDAQSGSHLWAESYDSSLEDSGLFDVQDDLTDRIVATVADQQGVLIRSMIAAVRDKPIEQMRARDAVFLMFDYMQIITPELHLRVREALERAVEVEPNSADAWACLSIVYGDEFKHDYNVRPDSLGRALVAGRRAADIDKACQHAYYALAQTHFFRRDFGRFRNAADRAVQINGRDGNTVAFMGILLAYAGDLEKGAALTRRALALNPHHPGWYRFGIFYRHFAREEYAEALVVAQAMNMPGYYATHVAVGAAAGLAGRLDVGREAVRELLTVYPAFAERGYSELKKWVPDEAVLERYFVGLQLAGLEVADSGLPAVDS
jgi:serine/threonine protein kinase